MNRRSFMRHLGALVPAVALAPLLPDLLRAHEKVPAVWMPKSVQQLADYNQLRQELDERRARDLKGIELINDMFRKWRPVDSK